MEALSRIFVSCADIDLLRSCVICGFSIEQGQATDGFSRHEFAYVICFVTSNKLLRCRTGTEKNQTLQCAHLCAQLVRWLCSASLSL